MSDFVDHRPGPGNELRLALAFLTRMPVRLPAHVAETPLAAAVRGFPLAGAAVAVVGALAFAVVWTVGLPASLAGYVAVAAMAAFTGALHEDGLADFADSLGARDPAKRLAIMRDSRIGTYGALALVLGVGLRVALLAPLAGTAEAVWTLAAVGALSRAPLGTMARAMPPARTDGLAVSQGRPSGLVALAAAALGIAIAAACVPGWPGATVGAAAGAGTVALLAMRRIGGVTGDVHGAAQQVAAVGALVGLGVVTA